jgi:SprT protein
MNMSPGISPELRSKLASKLPAPAVDEAISTLIQSKCKFSFSSSRKTKLGDFRPGRGLSRPTITVNADLAPPLFLLTFIHELAHVQVYDHYSSRIAPHGEEWKETYRSLLRPFLRVEIFGDRLSEVLEHYREAPASWSNRHSLSNLISKDEKEHTGETVDDLKEGELFQLRSGRRFKLGLKRRTRYLCTDLDNRKKYLVHGSSPVTRIT